jgi:hypothetical protein
MRPGRGNSGTPIGAPKFIQGQIGQALRYNTTTNGNGSVTTANYVTLGTPDDLHFGSNTSFSVAFWVRLPESAHPGDLPFFASAINSANNQGFTFCPSYQLGGWQWSLQEIVGVVTNNVDVNGADDSINDGFWHHFAATFDRTTATALTYLDGEQVNSTPIASLGTFDNLNPISIGQDPTGRYPEAARPISMTLASGAECFLPSKFMNSTIRGLISERLSMLMAPFRWPSLCPGWSSCHLASGYVVASHYTLRSMAAGTGSHSAVLQRHPWCYGLKVFPSAFIMPPIARSA